MSSKWMRQAVAAAVTLLIVAAGARLAWELLAPLVPLLLMAVALYVVYAVVFGTFRR